MKNYNIKETLASGSTSRVKRIVSTDEKEEYAIKIIKKAVKDAKSFAKELNIHKMLLHENIVKYMDSFEDTKNFYLIIELAPFELCTFIENNTGIDSIVVHYLIKQLVSGVEYMHENGICHRDIKPENILINASGRLLITDFGFSTFFIYKKSRRRLKSLVGTKEYMAPEVCSMNYDGELCDIWSIGITLINLLTGELPWNFARKEDERYNMFKTMKYHYYEPFTKIRDKILDLIYRILVPENNRLTILDIKKHSWMEEESLVTKEDLFRRMPHKGCVELVFTQPDKFPKTGIKDKMQLSQPIKNHNQISDFHRFYKTGKLPDVMKKVAKVLTFMQVQFTYSGNTIAFSTTDTKRGLLKGDIEIDEIDIDCYVTFKKTKGDFGEFRKFYTSFGHNF